ncbi:MAG: cation diffusion facilitator family transporter [Limnochordia bacterium]
MFRGLISKIWPEQPGDPLGRQARERQAVAAGFWGMAVNLLLFASKLVVGLWANSIAVISDAFNNLSDLGSAVVAVFGAKLSSAPPDKEHPHGHGRIEYVAALIVSFIIFSMGFELLHSSVRKVLNPEPMEFSFAVGVTLLLSIAVKLWLYFYNRRVGERINSSLNRAVAVDSLSDAVATAVILLGSVIARYMQSGTIDGYLGVGISLLIMYTGFSTARESANLLVGVSADPALVEKIHALLMEGEGIRGAHDLRIHDYGPGRIMASIHAEVDERASLVETHAEIDAIEERIEEELGVKIVIHMDPVPLRKSGNNQGGEL